VYIISNKIAEYVPSVAKAMEIMKRDSVGTLAEDSVQKLILRRIENTVKVANSSSHYARVYVPDSIAYILNKQPQLIAHAVGAYYYRDILQMKVCKTMSRFPAKPSSYHIIRFSRCLYAQLLRQRLDFIPSGYEALPPDTPSTAAEYKAKSLGHKLACGIELFYQEEKKKLGKNSNQIIPYPKVIDELLSTYDGNTKFTERSNADSEDWLNVSPEDVGDIIQEKQKELDDYVKTSKATGSTKEAPEDNLFDFMVKDMKQFLSKMSDIEGVDLEEDIEKDDLDDTDEEDQFYEEDIEGYDPDEDPLIAQMDNELNQTTMAESFVKSNGKTDANLNLVKNFLSSYENQAGSSGPVLNLLNQFSTTNKSKKKIK